MNCNQRTICVKYKAKYDNTLYITGQDIYLDMDIHGYMDCICESETIVEYYYHLINENQSTEYILKIWNQLLIIQKHLNKI